jgi:hypothetical protein
MRERSVPTADPSHRPAGELESAVGQGGIASAVLALQHAAGNRAVSALLSRQLARPAPRPPPAQPGPGTGAVPRGPGGQSAPNAPVAAEPRPWDPEFSQRADEISYSRTKSRFLEISLDPGGAPPDFIDKRSAQDVARVGKGKSVTYTRRIFHVLSALKHAVKHARNEDEVELVGWVYLGIPLSPHAKRAQAQGTAHAPELPTFLFALERADPRGVARQKTFVEAKRKRGSRRCRASLTSRHGGDRMHNAYADYVFAHYGNPTFATIELKLAPPTGKAVIFDHFDPETRTYYDAKTRHQALLDMWHFRWLQILARLRTEAEAQRHVLQQCVAESKLIWVFDDREVANAAEGFLGDILDEVVWMPWTSGRGTPRSRRTGFKTPVCR